MTTAQILRTNQGLLPLKQLAALGVHYQTLYGWARTGAIPHIQVGGRKKFDPEQVAVWLEKRKVGGR